MALPEQNNFRLDEAFPVYLVGLDIVSYSDNSSMNHWLYNDRCLLFEAVDRSRIFRDFLKQHACLQYLGDELRIAVMCNACSEQQVRDFVGEVFTLLASLKAKFTIKAASVTDALTVQSAYGCTYFVGPAVDALNRLYKKAKPSHLVARLAMRGSKVIDESFEHIHPPPKEIRKAGVQKSHGEAHYVLAIGLKLALEDVSSTRIPALISFLNRSLEAMGSSYGPKALPIRFEENANARFSVGPTAVVLIAIKDSATRVAFDFLEHLQLWFPSESFEESLSVAVAFGELNTQHDRQTKHPIFEGAPAIEASRIFAALDSFELSFSTACYDVFHSNHGIKVPRVQSSHIKGKREEKFEVHRIPNFFLAKEEEAEPLSTGQGSDGDKNEPLASEPQSHPFQPPASNPRLVDVFKFIRDAIDTEGMRAALVPLTLSLPEDERLAYKAACRAYLNGYIEKARDIHVEFNLLAKGERQWIPAQTPFRQGLAEEAIRKIAEKEVRAVSIAHADRLLADPEYLDANLHAISKNLKIRRILIIEKKGKADSSSTKKMEDAGIKLLKLTKSEYTEACRNIPSDRRTLEPRNLLIVDDKLMTCAHSYAEHEKGYLFLPGDELDSERELFDHVWRFFD